MYVAVDTGEKERNVCCVQLILPVSAVGTGEKERNVCCSVNTACVCCGRYRREREKRVLHTVNTACVCCGRS